MRDVITGLDSALRVCNAQIDGLNTWVEEMKSEDKEKDKSTNKEGEKE